MENNLENVRKNPLKTSVLFIVFNRLSTTKQVFEAIKLAKPPKLYIAADGARADKPEEKDKTKEVREYITRNIDWNCEVKTLFRKKNLGCKNAVSGAITWFFENEEMGIILEDDCVPNQSFFRYCEEMLEKYKNDTRIWHISGDNFQDGITRGDGSYYFSKYIHIWGWATWRRAWNHYDVKMKTLPEFIKFRKIESIISNKKLQKGWLGIFDIVYNNGIDTWDYQWVYTCFSNNGLSIMPNKNLISNIGFGEEGTHTSDKQNKLANMKVFDLGFPLADPGFVLTDVEADNYSDKKHLYKKPIILRILNKIVKFFGTK